MGELKKTRDVNEPYASLEHSRADWEWRILKIYKKGSTAAKDKYARAFCAVMSPMTYGSWEYGDVYLTELFDTGDMRQMSSSDEFEDWLDEYRDAGGRFTCRNG
ncbi:MAG: hypothetical protein GWN89_08915 [Thermoplasmata archaeon]|nr:hypothetical protein [Thermoplasmata archaeon]NIS20039.1 hypothetical protein [Thermoplasmata archaeon]NIT77239.1 hypothetical protein [Thermoplasmata archaeon]NIY03610.1 hypothetical protein [Thermoplasmata archaeon]